MQTTHVRVHPSEESPARSEQLAWKIAASAADPVAVVRSKGATTEYIDLLTGRAQAAAGARRRAGCGRALCRPSRSILASARPA